MKTNKSIVVVEKSTFGNKIIVTVKTNDVDVCVYVVDNDDQTIKECVTLHDGDYVENIELLVKVGRDLETSKKNKKE